MVQITILNIVSTYASRLKHLSLVLYHSHYFALLDGVHFEELESSVHSSTDALDLGLVRMPTPFNSESSPKLHEASFSLIDVPPLAIDLPWGQLTIIDAGLPYGRPLGFPEWRAFWTQCPNIKQATFVLPWEFTRRYSNLDAFSYPSLTKLTLVIPPSPLKRKERWTIFAGPAVFTNLEHLQLNLCHGREPSNPLLHRLEAFSKLKSISIQGCNSFDDDSLEYPMEVKTLVHDLVKQFHSLRSLNHLFMPYHYMDSNDIASLLHSHSPTSGYAGLNVTIDAGSIENVGIWKRKLEGERFSSIASRVELVSWEQNVIYSGHLASRSVSASSAQFASNYAKLPFH
ncbi:hypothetical protein D9611_010306 [Ephemerocybe angulata]|uniref:Uncharacterized protein n=1 Tax=Ephemerocybe angulata TaxID=980116 RepID=A0A8H5BCV2_9AGAR|nr:hypothetical protein D9611_010306 [Tulosesus angulatus]